MQEETTQGTNANNTKIAAILADVPDKNTEAKLIIQKSGAKRGRGKNRKVYGDDLVEVSLILRFKYDDLLESSIQELKKIRPEEIVVLAADSGLTDRWGKPVTTNHVKEAKKELLESLRKSLKGENESSTDEAFTPLEVDGKRVPGVRVYQGKNKDLDQRSIYLQGLKYEEHVLRPAENGPIPAPQSRGKSIAKRLLRQRIPVGLYSSYRLDADKPFLLNIEGTAPIHSKGDGVHFRKATKKEVFGLGFEDD